MNYKETGSQAADVALIQFMQTTSASSAQYVLPLLCECVCLPLFFVCVWGGVGEGGGWKDEGGRTVPGYQVYCLKEPRHY